MLPSTLPPGVSLPPPLWMISAEHSAERMHLVRHQHAVDAAIVALVTKHPAYYPADPVTAAARTLERLAIGAGMTTRMHVGLERAALEGRMPEARLGFRATWSRGRAVSAVWIEPELRSVMVNDERPGPDAKVKRKAKGKVVLVADPKRMPRGLDRHHVKMLGGPSGVVVSFAEVTTRVKALTS